METDIKIRLFCDSVCYLIRWRPIRPEIARELTAHLEDHAEVLMAQGLSRESASARAVAAMGNPYELGKALDALHSPFWHRMSTAVFCLSLVLLLILYSLVGDHNYDSPAVTRYYDLFYSADAMLEAYGYKDEIIAVVARGRTSGGGRLGDYWLVPGEAAAATLIPGAYAADRTPRTRLWAAVTDLHWQPWLEAMSFSTRYLSAYDSLGNRYSGLDGGVSYDLWAYTPLTGHTYLTLDNPDPDADWYVFEYAAPNGDGVSFRVTLDWGDYDVL